MEQNDSEDTKISGHLGSSPNLLNYHLFLKRYEQGNLLNDIDNKTVKYRISSYSDHGNYHFLIWKL